jgi:hypothetical protein
MPTRLLGGPSLWATLRKIVDKQEETKQKVELPQTATPYISLIYSIPSTPVQSSISVMETSTARSVETHCQNKPRELEPIFMEDSLMNFDDVKLEELIDNEA